MVEEEVEEEEVVVARFQDDPGPQEEWQEHQLDQRVCQTV